MEIAIESKQTDAGWCFVVHLEDRSHQVRCTHSYYQEMTQGLVSPDELMRASMMFLLEREGPEQILPEFELSLINQYFPEYETTMKDLFHHE